MITLDEGSHVYHVDSRPVPISVTGLLKYAGLIDDTWFNEYGRRRGQLTHLAIKYFNDGVLDEEALDPTLEPYFRAYVKFLVDSGFVVTASELMVYDPSTTYAGTLDLEGVFRQSPNIICIGDTKTGKMQSWTGIQTALYALARGRYRRRFGVELRQNGTYRVSWFDKGSEITEAKQILKKYKEEQNGNSRKSDG